MCIRDRAYTAQVVLLAVLAIHFAELLGLGAGVAADLKADLLELPAPVSYTHLDVYKRQTYFRTVFSTT